MRRALIGVLIFIGLASLIRHLPLSWVSQALPGAVGTPSGTVWNGQFNNVPLLGGVTVKTGLTGVTLRTPPGDVTLSGTVRPSGVDDLLLSMPVARLPMQDARLAGLSGRVSLRIDEARLKDGRCVSAQGTASTDLLAANAVRFDWAGPALSGPVDCQEGRLRVRLSGTDAITQVEATIITGMDGLYQSDIRVDTADLMAGNALTLFGFNPAGPNQYSLSEQGRWR